MDCSIAEFQRFVQSMDCKLWRANTKNSEIRETRRTKTRGCVKTAHSRHPWTHESVRFTHLSHPWTQARCPWTAYSAPSDGLRAATRRRWSGEAISTSTGDLSVGA